MTVNAVKKFAIGKLLDCQFGDAIERRDRWCCVCGVYQIKFLTLHHHQYYEDSITYNKFEWSDKGQIQYYAMLVDEIEKRPSNFTILCHECHHTIEKILKKPTDYNKDSIDLAMEIVIRCTLESRGILTGSDTDEQYEKWLRGEQI